MIYMYACKFSPFLVLVQGEATYLGIIEHQSRLQRTRRPTVINGGALQRHHPQ